jgi:protein-S-isoprenylcysteine O-methyltransferase Ste14
MADLSWSLNVCAALSANDSRTICRWVELFRNLGIHCGRFCGCVSIFFRQHRFYSKVIAAVLPLTVNRPLAPILKTLLFTVFVPGSVTILVPFLVLHGVPAVHLGPLFWLGLVLFVLGWSIYFRCAWEFAVRGLGTPAPIAPTRYLVVSGLHRYVRNPMYIGVFLVILGEAAMFGATRLVAYAAIFLLLEHLFVVLYEEPTLRKQFGSEYEEYRRSVPRWIPRKISNFQARNG